MVGKILGKRGEASRGSVGGRCRDERKETFGRFRGKCGVSFLRHSGPGVWSSAMSAIHVVPRAGWGSSALARLRIVTAGRVFIASAIIGQRTGRRSPDALGARR